MQTQPHHSPAILPTPVAPPGSLREITNEIVGIVTRRRAVIVLFCSIYAFMSVYLDRIFTGDPPRAIASLGVDLLSVHVGLLALLSVICTLRLSRLHYGMTLQGTYFAAVDTAETNSRDVQGAKRLNWLGVSTLHVLLTAFSASLAFGAWAGRRSGSVGWAFVGAGGLFLLLMANFCYLCHDRAVAKATSDISGWERLFPKVNKADRRRHDILTLDMCQHDMLAIVSSIGLLLFSLLQTMSLLQPPPPGQSPPAVQSTAPADSPHKPTLTEEERRLGELFYGASVVFSAVCGILAYVRLRRAVRRHSQRLNPSDPGAHVAQLTDSFLGYVLLVVFTVLAVNASVVTLLSDVLLKPTDNSRIMLWTINCLVALLALGVYIFEVFRPERGTTPGGANLDPANNGSAKIMSQGKHLSLVQSGGWEYVVRNNGTAVVGIIAVTDDRRIVVVKQQRTPVNREIVELPAGLAGDSDETKGESLKTAAQRELLEETGYQAANWHQLGRGFSSPGLTDESITFFLATGLTKTGQGGGTAGENIKVDHIPLDGIEAWVQAHNTEADMKLLAGLWLARNHLGGHS